MKATGKVNNEAMDKLSETFFLCLMKSVSDIRADVIESLTMPLLTGELQGEALPWDQNGKTGQHLEPKSMNEVRLITTAPYSQQLYERDDLHQTIEAHLDNDLCLAKAEQYGMVRANPNASGHWYDTYIDGYKSEFAKQRFSKYLKEELVK